MLSVIRYHSNANWMRFCGTVLIYMYFVGPATLSQSVFHYPLLASWRISESASVCHAHTDIFSMNPFWIDLSFFCLSQVRVPWARSPIPRLPLVFLIVIGLKLAGSDLFSSLEIRIGFLLASSSEYHPFSTYCRLFRGGVVLGHFFHIKQGMQLIPGALEFLRFVT